ncbi:MAG: lipoprotein [Gallionella sp.]|nr:lipoprotein [Gallionella sp.]
MRLKTSLAIIMVIGLLLQGCGRKGPLSMPVADAQKAAAPDTSSGK